MIKKVTIVKGYEARCGFRGLDSEYRIREKFVIENARVTNFSDSYYLIEGKAKFYKGNLQIFQGEIDFKRKVSKFLRKPSSLTIEEIPNAKQFIMED